ncbi:hypothetical protein F2P79_005480 [Pimephales promelas]|nr:hypothetical protein F2P79_005480 [Pimephales promelas]
MASEQQFRKCVHPCPRYIMGGDTHDLCVVCMGAQHAQSALEGAGCEHCERLPMKTLCSRRALFEESGSVRAPRGSGLAVAETRRRLASWGSQMDLSAGMETGSDGTLSLPLPDGSSASDRAGVRVAVSPVRDEAPSLQLSSSEELDVESIDVDTVETGDSPAQSPAQQELMDVLTRAVQKLSIDWPIEKKESRVKSKLDERFLPSHSLPPRRFLPFFPDLHTEVARSWNKPVSARILTHQTSMYSNIAGSKNTGVAHQATQKYIGFGGQSLLSGGTSSLVFTSILQAYQADLLRDVSEGDIVGADTIKELRQAADISLRATKETARAVGRSMSALVATERHLWLNLSNMKEKDKAFLLDAPLSTVGLFCDSVNSVIEKFQEEKKQAEALHKYLPIKVHVPAAPPVG